MNTNQSEIINPSPEPQPQPAAAPQLPDRLNQRQIAELLSAYSRFVELAEALKSPLVTPDTATLQAERAGLEKFLAANLLAHGAELLSCLHIVRNQYEPMLKVLATIARQIGIVGGNNSNSSE
jgi:hypothetical protein